MIRRTAILSTLLLCAGCLRPQIKQDETVLFFNTWAYQEADSERWCIFVHGWIFEPEDNSILRDWILMALSKALDLDDEPNGTADAVFRERARWFMVDNEGLKYISIRVGDDAHPVGISWANGHFQGLVRVPAETVGELARTGPDGHRWLSFEAVTTEDDRRVFPGSVLLMPPDGVSVISDIDDTIRVAHVRDPKKALTATFLRPLEVVPGMAELYRNWARSGATFHYISGCPWQLYQPLVRFMEHEGFPKATFMLKPLRMTGWGLAELLKDPAARKSRKIKLLLKTFPQRQFVLVGDSGEEDPEVYGDLFREYPTQVRHIFIRDVTGEPSDSQRFRDAFQDVPSDRWTVFEQVEQIKDVHPFGPCSSRQFASSF